MNTTWSNIAAHIVQTLGVQVGELVQVRDNIDFCNPEATVEVDGRVLVSEGRIAI